jgi:hypothetical protein
LRQRQEDFPGMLKSQEKRVKKSKVIFFATSICL